MADKIKLDYGLAEEMIKTFQQGHQQLNDTLKEMQNIANTLEQGALRGDGGQAFVEAIRGKLVPAIGRLADKFNEEAEDVQKAVEYMKEADQEAKSKF